VVDTEYGQYQPVEFRLLQGDSAKAVWEIRPLDGQTQFTTRKYGEVNAFWGQPGAYELSATVVTVDFEADTFDIKQYKALFKIVGYSPKPKPDDPVDPVNPIDPVDPIDPVVPDLPGDEFGNIGQRIDKVADDLGLQYDKRLAVSEKFKETAIKMKSGSILKVADARKFLSDGLNSLNLTDEWEAIQRLMTEDAQNRTPMSFEEVQKWYLAVAAGYKGEAL
jgi:hypothetical protein